MPSVSDQAVPSGGAEVQPPPRSSISHTLPHSTVPKWVSVHPRPLQTEYTTKFLHESVTVLIRPPYRQKTTPRPGRRCLVSMTTRRRPPWCLRSPRRPLSSATHRCEGSNGSQTRGSGTGRAASTLPMETVRYRHSFFLKWGAFYTVFAHVDMIQLICVG